MPPGPTASAVDLLLVLAALATAVSVVRGWRGLWDEELTAQDRQLATQAAVFLVPPVVVLLHELGHVVAVWSVGARVVELRYGVFEGSVVHEGELSAAANWWVAVAGNLVGVAVGLAMTAVGAWRSGLRRPLRYLLMVGGLVELGFSLVGYPVLSFLGSFGDWLDIYDFSSTPALSGATLAVHAAVLLALIRWYRSTLRPLLFAVSRGAEAEVARLQQAVAATPDDPEARLALADLFASGGDLSLARTALDEGTRRGGADARLHLARARVALVQRHWHEAVVAARAGLGDGDGGDAAAETAQRLWANLGLALSQMERAQLALDAFAHLEEPLAGDPRVRYGRALARLQLGQDASGRTELRELASALPDGHALRRWAEVRLGDGDTAGGHSGDGGPPAPAAWV